MISAATTIITTPNTTPAISSTAPAATTPSTLPDTTIPLPTWLDTSTIYTTPPTGLTLFDCEAVAPASGEPPNQIWVDAYIVQPNVLIVTAGTTVTWINFDVHYYWIESEAPGNNEGFLFFGEILPSYYGFGFPGIQNFSYTFDNPGVYPYNAPPDYDELVGEVIVTA
jgi:plastocyanin